MKGYVRDSGHLIGNPKSRSLGLLAAKILSSLSYWVFLMCPGLGYTLGTTSELCVVPAQGKVSTLVK